MPEVNAVVVESKRPERPMRPEMYFTIELYPIGWQIHNHRDGTKKEAMKYAARVWERDKRPCDVIRIPADHSHADEREGDEELKTLAFSVAAKYYRSPMTHEDTSALGEEIFRLVREARRAK